MTTETQVTELELIKQEADAAWTKFKEASDISTALGSKWVELNNRYKAALYDAACVGQGAAAMELRKLDASLILTK